jgi:uncharacterized repeat protein (TIGR01451 family)
LALALLGAPTAAAALPAVTTTVVTTPIANLGAHRGVTVSAACGPRTTLVGGGSYLRNAADPATVPTNGLVLGGAAPSAGQSPVDTPVAGGGVNPTHWTTLANFTGVSEAGDQAATFAMCATGGPAGTIVATASTTGANADQQVDPPTLTTATCPAGDRLVGGGGVAQTPDQINDGTTPGNNGNLKPLASYPSDAAGAMAADGSTTATSWTTYGSAGITAPTDTLTAFALCSTDPTTPPVRVARADVDGPDAQVGTTVTTVPVSCPTGTALLGGGFRVDESVGALSGLQPQQGYHLRGSFPSDAAGNAVADGASAAATWTTLLQAGGQNLPAGDHMTTHGFALCATTPAAPNTADLSVAATAAPSPAVVGQTLTYAITVANAGPATATAVVLSDTLPAGVDLDSATAAGGACTQTAAEVTCALGSLAAGSSTTATILVTPAAPGTLSNLAAVTATEPDPNAADDQTTTPATVVAADRPVPTLTGAATATATLGAAISDRVTLAGGAGPTGAITFTLYGPGDAACAMPLTQSSATAAGAGTYTSAPFTTTVSGTYRWVASYAGDGANAPTGPSACTDPLQAIAVRAAPSLTLRTSGATTLGGQIAATATLAGGVRITGPLTISVYGPGDVACTAPPLRSAAVAVNGNGLYGAAPFTTRTAGTYRWVASYAGDADNSPATTACGDPHGAITVAPAAAVPSSAFHLGTVKADRSGHIRIALTSPGAGQFRAIATAAAAHTTAFGSASVSLRSRTSVVLLIAPGAVARGLLRRHTKLRVAVAISFTPVGGVSRTRRVTVTVPGRLRKKG